MTPECLDPFTHPGRLIVTTESGATYLFDSRNDDRPVTVTRVIAHSLGEPADLRRDGRPIAVLAVAHESDGRYAAGIRVGSPMCLSLEPLGPHAEMTMRISTPVTQMTHLPDGSPGPTPPGA